jgi:hypothetical protein
MKWEPHKPGCIRAYTDVGRATVARESQGSGFVWEVCTSARGFTTSVAMGRMPKRAQAVHVAEKVLEVVSHYTQMRRAKSRAQETTP